MTFLTPSLRHRPHLNPEWMILILGLIILLLTIVIVATVGNPEKGRIMPDSAIAAETLIDETPDDIDVAVRPQELQGSVSMIVPGFTPPLKASVKTTALEASLADLLKKANVSSLSEIPKGTELLGVTVNGAVVTVDLSEEFVSGGGSTSMIERVEELKKAVQGVQKDARLRIAINGKPVPYVGGEGLELE